MINPLAQDAAPKKEKRFSSTTCPTKGVKSTSTVEVGNDVAGNIMEVVERDQIDMVIISTHGISGCTSRFSGEVTVP